ncbi:hypothetical protein ACFYT4_31755 [Streptomyces sp. NPDC004609]|uniref:hypothetical protein n=1 Tax=Streptomyces sp. NPDC004609 TaxID=3364704 RepID=UPI0036C66CD0
MTVAWGAEPVAGPVVDDHVLRHVWTALGPLVVGGWPVRYGLGTHHREETLAVMDEVLAGLHLAVDAAGRLRWLGKAPSRRRCRCPHATGDCPFATPWRRIREHGSGGPQPGDRPDAVTGRTLSGRVVCR